MGIKHVLMAGIVATGMIAASSASATTTIVNGSFENGVSIPSGGFVTVNANDSSSITGWTVGGGGVDYVGTYWKAADGTRSIDLSGNSAGSISQTLDTIIGQQYTVTFSLAGNPDGGAGVKVAVTSVAGSLPAIETFTVGAANTHDDMGWQTFNYRFTAFDTTSVLTFASATGSAYGPALDNVSISAVPEPATWGLMIVGFGMMGVAVRRRNVRTSVRFA